MSIHSTAVIDKTAEVDPTAEIGAYAIVERHVRIGPGVRLYPHAYVSDGTTLGARCQIHPFAVVGHHPQDTKWAGEPSYTEIGEETVVREHASVHRGTMPGSTTYIGRKCYLMATSHVGHNCVVGDEVTIANGSMLGGHIEVGRRAFISGNVVAHQFTRIGELTMIGGSVALAQDVPPFMLVRYPEVVLGTNTVGLRRAGIGARERTELRECYRVLYRQGLPLPQAVERVAEIVQTDVGRRLLDFLRSPSRRGILAYRVWAGSRGTSEEDEE